MFSVNWESLALAANAMARGTHNASMENMAHQSSYRASVYS